MMEKQIELSVIMPALNEEDNILLAIANVLNAFRALNLSGEIIVVNDGSTDRTKKLVTDFIQTNEEVSLLNHDKPRGIGGSFWDGVDHAKGSAVVLLPGDNENSPVEIFRYLKLLEHVDIVIPFVFNKEVRSLFRNGLSFIYRFIINSTFVVNFNYTNGTVLYRTSVLRKLQFRSMGFFFQTDILVRTVKQGYLFAEVPFRLGKRKRGNSKAVTFPSFINVVKGYLRLVRNYYFEGNKKAHVFPGDSQTSFRRGPEL